MHNIYQSVLIYIFIYFSLVFTGIGKTVAVSRDVSQISLFVLLM